MTSGLGQGSSDHCGYVLASVCYSQFIMEGSGPSGPFFWKSSCLEALLALWFTSTLGSLQARDSLAQLWKTGSKVLSLLGLFGCRLRQGHGGWLKAPWLLHSSQSWACFLGLGWRTSCDWATVGSWESSTEAGARTGLRGLPRWRC